MKKIRLIISSLLSIRFSPEVLLHFAADEIRRFRFVNHLCSISIVNMLIYMSVFIGLNQELFFPIISYLLANILISTLLIFLNKRGHHLAIRYISVVHISLFMLGAVFLLGTESGFHIFMLVSAMVPLLVWSSDKLPYTLAYIAFNIFAYLFFEFLGSPTTPTILFPEAYFKGFEAANTLGFFMTAGLGIWMFQRLYQQKESQLMQQASELKKNQEHRDRVYSIIAHDLRSPMSSYSGLIEIFLSDYNSLNDTDRKKMLRSMHDSTMSLNTLLNNLLDWSKLVSGRYENRITLLRIAPLVEDSLILMENIIKQKRFHVKVNIDQGLEVFADKHILLTVLRNLISNALKFTPDEGTITLQTNTVGNKIRLSIIDTGIGMSEMELNTLFATKLRPRKSGTNLEKGSGLGLMVCKELLETLNSKLEIASEPGKGSVFSFTLDTINT